MVSSSKTPIDLILYASDAIVWFCSSTPPSGILSIYILGTLTLLIGMGLAWAWGVITMKAALAARSQPETLARLQALGQEAARQANATGQSVTSVQQQLVYEGFMLDARVSVAYFVMTCVFIYFLVCPAFHKLSA